LGKKSYMWSRKAVMYEINVPKDDLTQEAGRSIHHFEPHRRNSGLVEQSRFRQRLQCFQRFLQEFATQIFIFTYNTSDFQSLQKPKQRRLRTRKKNGFPSTFHIFFGPFNRVLSSKNDFCSYIKTVESFYSPDRQARRRNANVKLRAALDPTLVKLVAAFSMGLILKHGEWNCQWIWTSDLRMKTVRLYVRGTRLWLSHAGSSHAASNFWFHFVDGRAATQSDEIPMDDG